MIHEKYRELCIVPSDINDNLPILREFASECTHITELGVRAMVSTFAFLEGLPSGGKLVSIDIKDPSEYGGDAKAVKEAAKAKGIDFEFVLGSSLEVKLEETDMIFFDTDHTYKQLTEELKLHAHKAKKFLAFHDIASCAQELVPAINEFLEANPAWRVVMYKLNNNGLVILEHGTTD